MARLCGLPARAAPSFPRRSCLLCAAHNLGSVAPESHGGVRSQQARQSMWSSSDDTNQVRVEAGRAAAAGVCTPAAQHGRHSLGGQRPPLSPRHVPQPPAHPSPQASFMPTVSSDTQRGAPHAAGVWPASAALAGVPPSSLGAPPGVGPRPSYVPTTQEARNDYTVLPIDLSRCRWRRGAGRLGAAGVHAGRLPAGQAQHALPHAPPAPHHVPSAPPPRHARRYAALAGNEGESIPLEDPGRRLPLPTGFAQQLSAARQHQQEVEEGKATPFLLFPEVARCGSSCGWSRRGPPPCPAAAPAGDPTSPSRLPVSPTAATRSTPRTPATRCRTHRRCTPSFRGSGERRGGGALPPCRHDALPAVHRHLPTAPCPAALQAGHKRVR